MSGADLETRVGALEHSVERIGADVGALGSQMADMGGKFDRLFDQMTRGDERTAGRAVAVKAELREEGDRKARDKSELFKNGLALVGAIVLVVGAITGPYLNKLNATSDGREQDAAAIGAVREVIANQSAEIGRNRDAIDFSRDRNRLQDDRLWVLNARLARIEGRLGQ